MYIRRNLCTHLSVNVPDVTEKRETRTEHLLNYNKNNLVFLDESGINIDLTRIYGRSAGGSRCVDKVPLSKKKNTTILSSIRLSRQTVYTTYQGGTNKDKFIDYLKNVLAPTLHENNIVIMDNMRTHHAKEVRKTIEDLKINVIYLPPYSPDFNPIEKMWSKIKSVLRKLKIRDSETPPHAVEYAFSKVRSLDCAGWFASCSIV